MKFHADGDELIESVFFRGKTGLCPLDESAESIIGKKKALRDAKMEFSLGRTERERGSRSRKKKFALAS